MNRTYGLLAAVIVGLGVLWYMGQGDNAELAHHDTHMPSNGATLYEAAVLEPTRPASDVERDAGRHPADVLAFMGVEPGLTVVEYQAGGGYYTRLLSHVVGSEGRVIAQQGPNPTAEREAQYQEIFGPLGNVEIVYSSREDLSQPPASVDLVVIVLIYHHMNYNADEGDVLPSSTAQAMENIKAMLKPGGKLVVIEHAALDSVTRAEAAAIHRASPARTRADFEAHGFRFVKDGTMLIYPDDPMNIMWRGNIPRDRSSRFVQMYEVGASE